MSLVPHLKKKLKDTLPLSLKLAAKRVFVGSVASLLRLGARVVNFSDRVILSATTHGLDFHGAWDVQARPRAAHVEPLSARDFLFLMDALDNPRPARTRSGKPIRASIIIPVFNKAEFTFQCLRSLLREIDFAEHEVIVVNNASRDETSEVLARFGDFVRVIHNDENKGFVEACNGGAAAARGQYLVFLNNDTVVLPGWLKHLVETVESDPAIGAVGSLFLYPDGIIQEAGGIVWQTGEAFHYGWGKSPDDKRYNFAREVDYCSGASLLVRKELFDRLGGFDRRFAPAYYEDADLCFGVRSLGYKVIYQPMSRLIHYEGVTAGADAGAGFKRFQLVNHEKFHDKWREVLGRDHLPNDPALVETAANRKRGPSILIIDDRVPTPDRDAGSARMVLILKSLVGWSRPVFVYLSQPPSPEYERQLWKEGVETATGIEYRRLLKKRKFAAAIVSRPLVAEALMPALRRADRQLKLVFDMVDAHFIRLEREHQLTGDAETLEEARRYRRIETRLARASDLVWCASTDDKRVMEREAAAVRIEVVPTIHPSHDRGLPFAQRAHLLFVGNFRHRPNADAVQFFMKDIFPLVRQSLPAAKLLLVGDGAPPEITAYESESVRVLGYVPDIEPLFQSCRVMIAPLRFGAGVKGKIGESLSYGLPVVTTSIGAEGMGLRHGAEAMIADAPQEFADALTRVYREPELWQRLSDNGYRHIEQYFSPPVIGKLINDSLREIGVSQDLTIR